MSMNHHQPSSEPGGQVERVSRAESQGADRSLWLCCNDPVMDRAFSSILGLDAALIFRPLRTCTTEHFLIDDVSLELIETAVRHRQILEIIVCGHAGCSSDPKFALQSNPFSDSSSENLLLRTWQREESNRQAQNLVLRRIRELQRSPSLALALSQGALAIHGLFYLAETGAFTVFDPDSGQFVPAGC